MLLSLCPDLVALEVVWIPRRAESEVVRQLLTRRLSVSGKPGQSGRYCFDLHRPRPANNRQPGQTADRLRTTSTPSSATETVVVETRVCRSNLVVEVRIGSAHPTRSARVHATARVTNSQFYGVDMSTSRPDHVDHRGAVLRLECRRHHLVGRLLMNRGWSVVEYRRADNPGQPERWPLKRADFWSEPACPGGCQFEVGAAADVLIGRVVTFANNPDADEDTFKLTDIAPAQL